jgi:hypothetical protein
MHTCLMTVTYASQESAERKKLPEILLVDVAPDGGTTVTVGPVAGSPGGSGTGDRTAARRMYWADPVVDAPGWQVFDPRPGHPFQTYPAPEPSPPCGPAEESDAWQRWIASRLADRLGDESWQVLKQRWQPEHCRIIEPLSKAVEATARPGTRTVIRLTELPPIVAGMLADVASRASDAGALPQPTRLAQLVRGLARHCASRRPGPVLARCPGGC